MSNPIPLRKGRGCAQPTKEAAETVHEHGATPAEVKELCRRLTPMAIEALVTIIEDPRQSAPARIACAQYIIDRGFGRPAQEIETRIHRSARDMTTDELIALADELGRAAGEGVTSCITSLEASFEPF